MGRLAHALPCVRATQRRGRCASLPGAAVAAKTNAQYVRSGASAADVTPSEPKVSDWRGGRAGPITSRISAARHRAWRVTGVTIWPAAANEAQRRERNAGQFVTRARSRTREGSKARDPRARERAAVVIPAGTAGLTWLLRIAMKAQP